LGELLAQRTDLLGKRIDLLLLPKNSLIELVEHIVSKNDFYFQFIEPISVISLDCHEWPQH
jgi:hypothetical protein